jgi:ABC transport system ATP-binding/permease protein
VKRLSPLPKEGYGLGMLQLDEIEVGIPDREDLPNLLKKVSLFYPATHFGAVIGPSGCGKSSLLKCISGILVQSSGKLLWKNRDLTQPGADLEASELGYVPQFSIFHEDLTVSEIIRHAVSLRLGSLGRSARRERSLEVLEQVGLAEIMNRRARVLSGGQRRRLGLAIELVSDPALLLCDEVTSGLDPKSEDEIVMLLYHLSQSRNRTVIHVTHSLRHMLYYQSITVMYAGVVAYQGAPDYLLDFFEVENRDDIFSALTLAEPEFWENKNQSLGLMNSFKIKRRKENREKHRMLCPCRFRR